MKKLVLIVFLCPFVINADIIRIPQDFQTIQEGIDAASVGDTVLVATGTYTDTHQELLNGFFINVCVTMRPGIVVISESGPDSTTITSDTVDVVVLVQDIPDTSTVISGFTIEFSEFWGILCSLNGSLLIENNMIKPRSQLEGIAVVFSNTSHGLLRNNEIQGVIGVLVERASSPLIANNVIEFCETAILNEDDFSSPIITGNLIINNETGFDTYAQLSNPILTRNIFVDNQCAIQASSDLILINNTLFGDSLGVWARTGLIQIYNTIVLGNNIPIDTTSLFGTLLVDYSDIQGGWAGSGNIDLDPMFINPDSLNFQLQGKSPCVDAGIDTIITFQGDTIVISDFQGSKPDMGSIESPFTLSIKTNENEILGHFILYHNYPNPFNPSTKIKYSIPQTSNVVIKVFDILGNEIATLVNKEKSAGTFDVEFNASGLPSGIYFYRLQAGRYVETRKMVLLK